VTRQGLRVVLAGASGALGSELARVLGERGFPIAELYPFGTDRSLGSEVELGDDDIAIEPEAPPLHGYDLMFICTPPGAALDLVRDALRAELACIDCSGALVRSRDVPLGLADRSPAAELVGAPVIAAPAGPALAWGRVLTALDDLGGLVRVAGTVLQTASRAGTPGIDALSDETVSLLSSQSPPAQRVFPTEVAFDCVPRSVTGPGPDDADGGIEADLAATLERLVGRAVPLAASVVQVPAFIGEGSSLFVELAEEIEPGEALAALDKVPGIARYSAGGGTLPGPSTRDASGSDDVLVGSLRADASRERGLQLWMVADPLRLAASNAVKLAEARIHLH
jgi:aspartate-semialdehyde dehydrogenase